MDAQDNQTPRLLLTHARAVEKLCAVIPYGHLCQET